MDFRTLERLWASNGNDLSQTAQAYLLETVSTTLHDRRRRFTLWMVFVGIKLSVFTALVVALFLFGREVAWPREWAVALLLVIPWIGFIVFKLQFHRHLKAFPAISMPMQQNLEALLDENLTTQRRARAMAIMHAVFAAVTVVALSQLVAAGKMTARNGWQAGMLFAAALAVSAVVQAVVHFGFTAPEGARLRRLLLSYDDPA